MLEAVGEVFPETKYQRRIVHFYHNGFSVVPKSKVKTVAQLLKTIHAQESKKAAREKARAVMEELKAMKLKEAAKNNRLSDQQPHLCSNTIKCIIIYYWRITCKIYI